MNAGPPSTVWRSAAGCCALAIIGSSLLPPERLPAWAPDLDRGIGGIAVWLAAGAGLLVLAALTLRRIPAGGRLKLAPGLRLSRPLSLALVVYVAGLALIASGDLRAAVWGLAVDRFPAWLNLAAERLTAAHTLAYAGLGLLIALGWGRRADLRLAGLLVLALSGALELLQGAVPGRSPNWWDLLANGVGVAAGLAAGRLLGAWPRPADSDAVPRRRRHHRRTAPGPAAGSSMRRG